jgi:membrane protein implicated in regulation of membrane protease activity
MALDATARRRWFGAVVLLAALAMLICGVTVLKEKLGYLAFILYWMVCFALTILAIIVAFLDARALQRRTRQEQHDLFATTLKQIETEARTRPNRRDRRQKRS